jgi:hypothetical protein
MKVYKRKISNVYNSFFSEDGTEVISPKTIQIFLTQSIEDIGIYEDVVGDNRVTHDDPGDLNVDTK